MPEISRFFGIVIKMFFDDHNPQHFHAVPYNHVLITAQRHYVRERRKPVLS